MIGLYLLIWIWGLHCELWKKMKKTGARHLYGSGNTFIHRDYQNCNILHHLLRILSHISYTHCETLTCPLQFSYAFAILIYLQFSHFTIWFLCGRLQLSYSSVRLKVNFCCFFFGSRAVLILSQRPQYIKNAL